MRRLCLKPYFPKNFGSKEVVLEQTSKKSLEIVEKDKYFWRCESRTEETNRKKATENCKNKME